MPTLLWLLCGAAAALVAGVRVQLALLALYPAGGWLVLAAGLLVSGLVLALAVVIVRCYSLRATGLMVALIVAAVAAAGVAGVRRFPAGNFESPELRGEWSNLHPTLRLALWVARLGEGDLVLTGVGLPGQESAAAIDTAAIDTIDLLRLGGYARGADVRVAGAGELRRWARQGAFLLMGLRASPHGESLDQLRVSLPVPLGRG